MGRAPCCDKANVKKGPWSPEEDAKLKEFIEKHGTGGNWIALPHKAGLKRCGKSCRLRWLNYLRPNIKHGEFSDEEDRVICTLYASIGSRWSIIAGQLPGRTDNDIKNYWNTKLKKKLIMGINNPSKLIPLPFSPNNTFQPQLSHTQPPSSMHAQIYNSPIDYNSFYFQSNPQNLNFTSPINGHLPPPSTAHYPNFFRKNQDCANLVDFQQDFTGKPKNSGTGDSNLLVFGGSYNETSGPSSSEGSCCNKIGHCLVKKEDPVVRCEDFQGLIPENYHKNLMVGNGNPEFGDDEKGRDISAFPNAALVPASGVTNNYGSNFLASDGINYDEDYENKGHDMASFYYYYYS